MLRVLLKKLWSWVSSYFVTTVHLFDGVRLHASPSSDCIPPVLTPLSPFPHQSSHAPMQFPSLLSIHNPIDYSAHETFHTNVNQGLCMLNVRVRACGSVCRSVIIVTVVWFQRVKPESVLNQRCDFVNLGIGILSQARPPSLPACHPAPNLEEIYLDWLSCRDKRHVIINLPKG